MLALVPPRQELERTRTVSFEICPVAGETTQLMFVCLRAEDAKTDVIFNAGSIFFPICKLHHRILMRDRT